MKIMPLLLMLIICSFFAKAARLPVGIELDRYLIEARQLIEEDKAFEEAKVWLDKAQQLGIALTPDFYYLNSKYLFAMGLYKEAEANIVKYLDYTGRLGSHYASALAMITALETNDLSEGADGSMRQLRPIVQRKLAQPLPAQPSRDANGIDSIDEPLIKPIVSTNERGMTLIERVKKLTDKKIKSRAPKPYQPFEDSINKMLRDNAIFERDGVEEPTLVYSIKAAYDDMLVVTKAVQGMEGLQLDSHNIVLNQIPGNLGSECSWQEQRCWIIHPINHQRWLEINYSEDVKAELLTDVQRLLDAMRAESKNSQVGS